MCEELNFFLDACRDWGVVRRWVGVTNNIEDIQMDNDEGEHSKTLLFIEVAENTRDGLLAFAVRQNLNEWVWRRVAIAC